MEVLCGKPIDPAILKLKHDKAAACEANRQFCESLSRNVCACPVCGNNRRTPLVEVYNFSYAECLHCSLVYIENPPTPQEIERLYNSAFYDEVEQSLYGDVKVSGYRIEQVAAPKVRYVEERLGRKGKWLDVGCGTGEILAAARARGWVVQGVETNQRAAQIGAERFGVPISKGFITDSEHLRQLSEFDVVSMFGVLEHLYEPGKVIDSVSKGMPDSGVLVIEVPHYPSVSCFSQMAFPNFVDRILVPPMHLMVFTLQALQYLLRRSNIEITHVWFYGQDFHEWLSTLSAMCPKVVNRRIFEDLMEMNGEIQQVIDNHHLSDEMLVIARKC